MTSENTEVLRFWLFLGILINIIEDALTEELMMSILSMEEIKIL